MTIAKIFHHVLASVGFALLLFSAGTSPAYAQFDRPWRIYLVPFSHTDVGYTAPVDVVLQNHLAYLDTAVAWVGRTRSNPANEQFRWTIEIPWVLDAYIRQRSAAQVEELMTCVRSGEIEIGGMYFGLQTDLCGNEELVRSLMFSQELRNSYQVPVRTAFINDTPGLTWSLAQIFPRAGIPYLSLAMNSFLSDFYTTTSLPNLFRLQAPGGERLLVWRSIDPQWAYLEGTVTCRIYASGPAVMQTGLTSFLQGLAAAGYPYNEVMINCATGDNGAPNFYIVNNAREWNSIYPDAKILISTATAFFDTMEARHGATIPVVSGDAPNYWTWLFAPSATRENALSRKAHRLLPAAETFATLAAQLDPGFINSPGSFRDAYINNLTFEDHNLGAVYSGGNEPFWVLKKGWITAAVDTGTAILARATDAFARSISTGAHRTIVVFNPLIWPRSIPVTLPPEQVQALGFCDIQDALTGQLRPVQMLHDGSVCFVAPEVPPVGYALYTILPRPGSWPLPMSPGMLTLENDHYRLRLDASTGGALSVVDKASGTDLATGTGRFNQYRYNSSQTGTAFSVADTDSGPVLQRVTLQGSAPGSNVLWTTAVLYHELKRIDFLNRYDKLAPTLTETVDFDYHFALSSAKLRYDIPFADVRLFDDELSGFRPKHYAAGQWCAVISGANTIAGVLALENASVTAHPGGTFDGSLRLMISFNNSGSAYRAGTGLLSMNYSLTTTAGFAVDSSMRHAYSAFAPAPFRILPAGQTGALPNRHTSFLQISPASIFLSTVKTPLSGNGIIVRLFNPSPQPVSVTLRSYGKIRSAFETSLLEDGGIPLPFSSDTVFISFGPYEIKTLHIDADLITSVEPFTPVPEAFSLEQNYPNPFNGQTRIGFSIGRNPASGIHKSNTPETRVVVSVFDILGRKIADLVDAPFSPGQHHVLFDASGLSSGVYLYQIRTGGFSSTRKMVLIR